MEFLIYHWLIDEIDVKILLPNYGLVCGSFNIAEKQVVFIERLLSFPPGAFIRRVGVENAN